MGNGAKSSCLKLMHFSSKLPKTFPSTTHVAQCLPSLLNQTALHARLFIDPRRDDIKEQCSKHAAKRKAHIARLASPASPHIHKH